MNPRWSRRLVVPPAIASLILAATVASAHAQDTPAPAPAGLAPYIVVMAAEPVAGYAGGTPGLAATKPAPGHRIDRSARAVDQYASHLEEQHEQALAGAGIQLSAPDTGPLAIVAAPAAAELGGTGTVTVAWSGLDEGTAYLGAVSHTGPAGLLGLTLVHIENSG